MKNFNLILILFIIVFVSCEEEVDETSNMCYTLSGNNLSLSCTTSGNPCTDGTFLGKYATWSDCTSDWNEVGRNFELNSVIQPGPNAIGSGGGASNCGGLTYNGPTGSQVKQWCQNAQILQCIDSSSPEYGAQCQILKDNGVSNCPYCN